MIFAVQEYKWTKRLISGLYRERFVLLPMFTLIPVLVFLVLLVALGKHPGPHGLGVTQSLAGAFTSIYCALLVSLGGMVAVVGTIDALLPHILELRPEGQEVPSAPAGDPPFRTSREKRPPRT